MNRIKLYLIRVADALAFTWLDARTTIPTITVGAGWHEVDASTLEGPTTSAAIVQLTRILERSQAPRYIRLECDVQTQPDGPRRLVRVSVEWLHDGLSTTNVPLATGGEE